VSSADYRKLSDEELVHRFVHRNDHICINLLFERYGHLVMGVCLKHLKNCSAAKDATQQIFIKLLEDLHKFRIENFRGWLLQVTKNHCLMQLRKPVDVMSNEFVTNSDMDADEEWQRKLEQEHLYEQMETAIKSLNDGQRTCIRLFYMEKLTYAAIASQTKYTVPEVKSHLQNGKRNLKIKLETLVEGARHE